MVIHAINYVLEIPGRAEGKLVPANAARIRIPTPTARPRISFQLFMGRCVVTGSGCGFGALTCPTRCSRSHCRLRSGSNGRGAGARGGNPRANQSSARAEHKNEKVRTGYFTG